MTVEKKYVVAYWNERDEDEYVVDLPRTLTLQRLHWGPAELESMAGRYKPDTLNHTTQRLTTGGACAAPQVFVQRDGGDDLEKASR